MGRLIGIAIKPVRRGAMETVVRATITPDLGVVGDRLGALSQSRRVTIIRVEDWATAIQSCAPSAPWVARRANLLVQDVPSFSQTKGYQLHIGSVVLHITGECEPCSRMDDVAPGLRQALTPEWRGGVTASVLTGGDISLEDPVILVSPHSISREHSHAL